MPCVGTQIILLAGSKAPQHNLNPILRTQADGSRGTFEHVDQGTILDIPCQASKFSVFRPTC